MHGIQKEVEKKEETIKYFYFWNFFIFLDAKQLGHHHTLHVKINKHMNNNMPGIRLQKGSVVVI